MKNKTKIEVFTQTGCCEPAASQNRCDDCQCDDPQCDCEISCLSTDTAPGKARAKELNITSFPALAINDQAISCAPVANAIAKALSQRDCCCC